MKFSYRENFLERESIIDTDNGIVEREIMLGELTGFKRGSGIVWRAIVLGRDQVAEIEWMKEEKVVMREIVICMKCS